MELPSRQIKPHLASAAPFRWSFEIIAIFGVIVLTVFFATRHSKTTVITTNTTSTTASTIAPDSYTDFSGTVTKIEPALLTVALRKLEPNGTVSNLTYAVTIDDQTQIQSVKNISGVSERSALALQDIKVGQTVVVGSDTNVARVTSFTAKKILAY